MSGSGEEITKVNSVHGVFEYEPKEDRFELFEKGKENRFNESEQRDDTVQNENENLIETNRRERNIYPVDSLENRYNHSKAKKRGIHGRDILKNVHWI